MIVKSLRGHEGTKARRKGGECFEPLPPRVEWLAKQIVDCAFQVHSTIGPGLLETVYEACFCHELHQRGIPFQRQIDVPIAYKGVTFQEALRLDVLADDLVICELKAVDHLNPVWESQLLSHLHLTGRRLGFLINFNVPRIKDGISRYIL